MNIPLKNRGRMHPPEAGITASDGPHAAGGIRTGPVPHGSQPTGKNSPMHGWFPTAKSHGRSGACVAGALEQGDWRMITL